ncbi:MAG: hypothetical protein O3A10_00170 [Chloroflexi bacterium]|nr:hypothetical protein [Chloroflexota bacterium]MDA1145372.1 hypothetical protein [Chloroflexota bacterium]
MAKRTGRSSQAVPGRLRVALDVNYAFAARMAQAQLQVEAYIITIVLALVAALLAVDAPWAALVALGLLGLMLVGVALFLDMGYWMEEAAAKRRINAVMTDRSFPPESRGAPVRVLPRFSNYASTTLSRGRARFFAGMRIPFYVALVVLLVATAGIRVYGAVSGPAASDGLLADRLELYAFSPHPHRDSNGMAEAVRAVCAEKLGTSVSDEFVLACAAFSTNRLPSHARAARLHNMLR